MELADFLSALKEVRKDQVVVTTMASAREWPNYSDGPLDLNYAPSSMGQGPALGLGIALARPERQVIVLNGDGCTLMNLGVLVTIAGLRPVNLVLFNLENGVYEVTGGQKLAGSGRVGFTGVARSAGWERVYEIKEAEELRRELPGILRGNGPVFINVKLVARPGPSPKPRRPMPETLRMLSEALAAGSAGRQAR
ncbi:MAG: thiamine pyrophosphate-binding protein [Planctomycetes bacterium]|nr:thiamine pyrophosphate-binding protein [Planctomycetota bacterium]